MSIDQRLDRTLSRARLYKSWGCIPIPIKPGSKSPFGLGWQNTRISESETKIMMAMRKFENVGKKERGIMMTQEQYESIKEWCESNDPLNLGIICGRSSGIIVLDIDVRGGGTERWKKGTEIFGTPDTFIVQTGSGGLHVYFSLSRRESELKTNRDSLGTGWDIRSDNGQVLGPYSRHPITRALYIPRAGFVENGDIVPTFAKMPEWILDPISVMYRLLISMHVHLPIDESSREGSSKDESSKDESS